MSAGVTTRTTRRWLVLGATAALFVGGKLANLHWRAQPGAWTAALYILPFLIVMALWIAGAPSPWLRAANGLIWLGGAANGAAVLANGGRMPYVACAWCGEAAPEGIHVLADRTTRLAWLIDRFGGASAGDLLILAGLLLTIAYWSVVVGRWLRGAVAARRRRSIERALSAIRRPRTAWETAPWR